MNKAGKIALVIAVLALVIVIGVWIYAASMNSKAEASVTAALEKAIAENFSGESFEYSDVTVNSVRVTAAVSDVAYAVDDSLVSVNMQNSGKEY